METALRNINPSDDQPPHLAARLDFHAATGENHYDLIAFSGPPIANLLPDHHELIHVVRHIGVEQPDLVASRSCHDDADSLVVNLHSYGEYWGTVGGERVHRPLRRGGVSFVPAGVEAQLVYPASHSVLILYLQKELLRGILSELGEGTLASLHSEDRPMLAQLARMIAAELQSPSFASRLVIDGLARALCTGLVRVDTERAESAGERIHLPIAKLRRVDDFIEANLDCDIGLADLAALVGLSPFHFSRVFKRERGDTPCQYIRSRRIERARQLLIEGDMPLAELSLACGFANQSHFTAAFTRAMGVSPARFRRMTER